MKKKIMSSPRFEPTTFGLMEFRVRRSTTTPPVHYKWFSIFVLHNHVQFISTSIRSKSTVTNIVNSFTVCFPKQNNDSYY